MVPVTETPEPKKPEPLTVKFPEIVVLLKTMLVKLPLAALTVVTFNVVPLIVVPVTEVNPAVPPVTVVN